MSDSFDFVLKESGIEQTGGNGSLTSKHIYENSGHRLLCSKCRVFRRTLAEWVEGPMLRITCKTCKTNEDFVVTDEGLVAKKFFELSRSFMRGRIHEILGGKKLATDSN